MAKKNNIVSADYERDKEYYKSNINDDKQTKKKTDAQKAVPILLVAVVSLVIVLVCVLIAYYQVYKTNKQNANTLEGVYTASYYSMVDNVNNLSVDLNKYSTLTTTQSKLNTMQDMMTDCNYILAGLGTLPINQENVVAATKFFNQVNGVCQAYCYALTSGKGLTQEQELLFDEVGLVLEQIKDNFNRQNYGMYDSGFNFIEASVFDKNGMNELSGNLSLTNDEVKYPSMIFDGPFSTALENVEVRGLPINKVTKEDAYNYLANTVYKNRDVQISYDKLTEGDIETFDFNVDVEGKHFTAQVSVRGGLLITLSGYGVMADSVISEQDGVEMAKNFANNIGFESMQYVWKELHENILYVNLAPVVGGVIYYPDLVKVKIDLTAQDVIGVDAVNYALNHVNRTIEFNATAKQAEELLGFDYEILETNKTVIRLDSGIEVECYEFTVEKMDGNYFYYINANNLEIEKVLKLVTVKNVEKLI